MHKITFDWMLSHASEKDGLPTEKIPALVPGAVQLDYAKAKGYAPYYYGLNFKQFEWTEDEYFFYETTLDFNCTKNEYALLCFDGIDYTYEIALDGKVVAAGKGAFTPVRLDVTSYSGKKTALRVTIFPIPKRPNTTGRSQASACCKPPSSYGWDWHPRLVPSGIWKDAYLAIRPLGSPYTLDASYRLTEDLSSVTVNATAAVCGDGLYEASLISPDGKVVSSQTRQVSGQSEVSFTLTHDAPALWYPRGYGEQPRYTLRVSGEDALERRIGFRRSQFVLNEGCGIFSKGYPKGPDVAPIQLVINGQKVFCKGSNWVNTEVFPSLATPERYDELIDMAYDANFNIFRLWGGQYINHDYFYDKCDELGIMVWQEFMLSCNLYPNDDDYLDVLKAEATSIIKSLRTHPCLAFWCGGNELFNGWSGMDVQSHPLRLLDALCYEHDRFTPFNMTSPLHGMTHGYYQKVAPDAQASQLGDYTKGEEFITTLKNTKSTAYTEFGCNGASPKDYILKYIMDEKDYADRGAHNPVWKAHHGYAAWQTWSWMGDPEVIYYFGGFENTDDLIEKTIYLQDMCYKVTFEEMRRQAPLCSMAINWDYNEPWPCAAGNSLVNWPAKPKSALDSVKQALRPTLLSLDISHNRYLSGETLCGNVWLLNDSAEAAPAAQAQIFAVYGDQKIKLADIDTGSVEARKNGKFGSFEFVVSSDLPERFSIALECPAHPEWSSCYALVHNKTVALHSDRAVEKDYGTDMNIAAE